ncbi:glycosyltransferase family A protein [Algoriphagus hitonicola]|uniref:Glycosyltransferase involved in cell wall bisynthesis n=1 Tax=Algoriphagus hitonicola TaxID=435880 RepID=A0A1I2TNX2_9BACT|nr:glycosyltransferase family 2 protein [Algoriphagus hitonicola]SFG64031.1 Glycosyltransferase involved in cell wall bisynthesis [Algoriphagus hitonicola]
MLSTSVIIPVFNAVEYLRVAVESAIHFGEVVEVLLVDDMSTDNSLEEIQELAKQYDKVRNIPNQQKRYASGCRNLAILQAKGDLIAFLDADDWYYPNRFKKDLDLFTSNSKVKITYSYSTINFPNGKTIPYGVQHDFSKTLNDNSTFWEEYHYSVKNDLVLGHVNANTVHMDVFKNGDFWDGRLKVHADTEFWWRLNRKYKFYASELAIPVSAARRHDHNTIYNKSVKTKTIMLLVWMDNIGIKNLYGFEKRAVIYHLARAISNPIKKHLLRKSVLHGFQWIANALRPVFIPVFYRWGMAKYKLYKE